MQLRETALPGPIPRYEVPGWRKEYGVVAGITGRGEGKGRGFDLGLWTEAPVGEVMGRWRAFRAVEPGFGCTVLSRQVHESTVVWHEAGTGWLQIDGADGHATAAAGVMLTVTLADCIPVYLLAPKHRAIALLHAGWRGTSAGILPRGVQLLSERLGAPSHTFVMHCGVGICGACYEVGTEVRSACGLPAEGSGPWRLDLREVLVRQALDSGLKTISTSQWCSAHDWPKFYSHRASRGSDGRMVAYLGMPGTGNEELGRGNGPRGATL